MTKPIQWSEVPPDMQKEFLLDNTIKLENWYIDEVNNVKKQFPLDEIERFINCAKLKQTTCGCYGHTDEWLMEALESISVENKTVAIMGSIQPWYESVVIADGGFPTVLEYNLPNYNDPRIQEMYLVDALKNKVRFDMGISISSFEHDGLGRYGDPLNPTGDFRAMREMKQLLKKDGVLFLSVPIGLDKLVWNAHRVYGNKRLPKLIEGWEIEGAVGYDENFTFTDTGNGAGYQPIIVLKNI